MTSANNDDDIHEVLTILAFCQIGGGRELSSKLWASLKGEFLFIYVNNIHSLEKSNPERKKKPSVK